MAKNRKKKSASTTKSNTPVASPLRNSKSNDFEKATIDYQGKKEISSGNTKASEVSVSSVNPAKKKSWITAFSTSKPRLRSRTKGMINNDVLETIQKKAHEPLSISSKANNSSELQKSAITKTDEQRRTSIARRWSVSSEILLLKCLADNKPSGIHKHFHMANICYLFNKNNACPRSVKEIWAHLETMYDLQAIDEMEFSGPDEWSIFQDRVLNLNQFQEFSLSEAEFKDLMDERGATV